MAGVKGRSGRKSRYHEAQQGRLEKLAIDWVVDSWDKFDLKTKLALAKVIVPKTITEKKEINGGLGKEEVQRYIASAVRGAVKEEVKDGIRDTIKTDMVHEQAEEIVRGAS